MPLPKGNQIAAARALLGWDQKEVAHRVGLTIAAISKIEKGENKGKIETLEKIERAFYEAGIEFTDNDGVKIRSGYLTVYRGHDGFTQFRKEVLALAQEGPLDICVSNVDERNFSRWGGADMNANYREQMSKIDTVTCRIIVKKGDRNFVASGFAAYRWAEDGDFGDIPFYIFGDKTAIIPFQENELHIFIINHPLITKFYRQQFEKNWVKSTPVDGA